MRPKTEFTESQRREVREALKSSKGKEEFQRVQAVLMRMELGLDAARIADILGMHRASVWRIHARFLKDGCAIFKSLPHGGRRRENLSPGEERGLLEPFLDQASNGGMIVVSSVKEAYERRIGRQVPDSTICRLLARHGWRKIVPRPSHPKADPAAREAFKKTSRR
jgi:transposase